jgi:AcrR family transcriptional regulator
VATEAGWHPQVARSRAAVIDAARELLGAGGWDAVTHATVAQRSGVGRTTVYRHWPTAEQLLRDVLQEACAVHHATPVGELRSDLIEELDVLRAQLGDPAMERSVLTVMNRASIDGDFAELVGDLHRVWSAALRPLLKAGRERGELDAGLKASRGVAALLGPLVYQQLVARKAPGRGFVERLVDDFLRGQRFRPSRAGRSDAG